VGFVPIYSIPKYYLGLALLFWKKAFDRRFYAKIYQSCLWRITSIAQEIRSNMKQHINKRSEVCSYGSLDARLLTTDLSGKLMPTDVDLAFNQLSDLSPDFLPLMSSQPPYSLDVSHEGHAYRVKGRQYQDRIEWYFTDISDLMDHKQASAAAEHPTPVAEICEFAYAIPGSGAYPPCRIAKEEINLRLILEESKQYIALFDENLVLHYCNQQYARAVFDHEGIYPKVGENVLERLSPEQSGFWYKWFEQARKGQEATFEVAYRGKKGDLIYLDTHLRPLLVDGHFRGIIQFTTNISEKKKLDQQLEETEKIQSDLRDIEQNYKLLIDNIPGFVTLLNERGDILFMNQANTRQLGETTLEHRRILEECRRGGLDQWLQQTIATQEAIEFESRIYAEASSAWFVHHLVPIIREKSVSNVMMISTEITAQKNQELQLRHSIDERDALLKEIHHRVKNNLQIISSILYLKSTQLHDADSRQVMEECNRRIRSMHMIHELLLQEQDLSSIDPGMYLEKLIHEAYHTFRLPEQEVQLECDIEQMQIGANKVMTIAMIIYELLSNALLHAFVDRDQGTITIRLKPSTSNINLCVIDNGVGMPEEDTWEENLGILLVKTFATQIKASLKMNSGNEGTHFCIQFNNER